MRYLVVLPAFNEEKTIGAVIEGLRKAVPFADMLVVNDGSSDTTGEIARADGIAVVDHPFNLGYGAALQTGFRFALTRGYNFVITMDADGQHVPSSVADMIATMEATGADVVIGSRFKGTSYKVGLLRRLGIALFSCIARVYTGIAITDPTSGFQLLNRKAFAYLAVGDNYPLDYPDVNIIMALHKKMFKLAEAPVTMIENKYGKSMHGGLRPVFYVAKMFLAILMVLVRRTAR
jgi:glycosyltransferase involved in cell wall biosynthesis